MPTSPAGHDDLRIEAAKAAIEATRVSQVAQTLAASLKTTPQPATVILDKDGLHATGWGRTTTPNKLQEELDAVTHTWGTDKLLAAASLLPSPPTPLYWAWAASGHIYQVQDDLTTSLSLCAQSAHIRDMGTWDDPRELAAGINALAASNQACPRCRDAWEEVSLEPGQWKITTAAAQTLADSTQAAAQRAWGDLAALLHPPSTTKEEHS